MVILGILLLLAFPVLAIAFTTPIYSDEIVWKIMQARYLLDHGLATNAFPQCGPSFLLAVPFTHLPRALLDSLVYQDLSHPLKLRVLGLAGALATLVLLYTLVRVVTRPPPRRSTAVSLVLAFWGIGAMPLLLVLNRPELPLLLGILGLILAVVLRRRPGLPRALRSETMALFFYVALIDFLLATHPKMLFFLPLLMTAGSLLLSSTPHRIVAVTALLLISFQTHQFASARGACPDSAWTASNLDRLVLKPGQLLREPRAFVRQGLANVADAGTYVRGVTLGTGYLTEWFDARPPIPYLDRAGDRLIYLVACVIGVTIVRLVFLTLRDLYRSRRLDPPPALGLALVVSLTLTMVFQTVKNSYDGSFGLALAFVAMILQFRIEDVKAAPRLSRGIFGLVLFTAVVSQVRLIQHFGPSATTEWLAGGDLAGQNEGWISAFHYDRVNSEVRSAARLCGIDIEKRPKFLVVDDLTYPALLEATYPIHTMGLTWWGHGIRDQYEFLKAMGSEGVVVRCRSVRAELQARARRQGSLCCLPALGGGG